MSLSLPRRKDMSLEQAIQGLESKTGHHSGTQEIMFSSWPDVEGRAPW